MGTTVSSVDIGAMQRIQTGSPTAKISYVDIGAAQIVESAAAPFIAKNPPRLKQAVNRAGTY